MYVPKLTTVLSVCLMASLCACSGTSGNADPCRLFSPVYVADQDSLTDTTARAVLTNNRAGQKHCGWKPTGRSSDTRGRPVTDS